MKKWISESMNALGKNGRATCLQPLCTLYTTEWMVDFEYHISRRALTRGAVELEMERETTE